MDLFNALKKIPPQGNVSKVASKGKNIFNYNSNKLQSDVVEISSNTKKKTFLDKIKSFFVKEPKLPEKKPYTFEKTIFVQNPKGVLEELDVVHRSADGVSTLDISRHTNKKMYSAAEIAQEAKKPSMDCFVRYDNTDGGTISIDRFRCKDKNLAKKTLEMLAKKSQNNGGNIEARTGYSTKWHQSNGDLGIKELWDLGFKFNDEKANKIVQEKLNQGKEFIYFEECPDKMFLPKEKIAQLIAEE